MGIYSSSSFWRISLFILLVLVLAFCSTSRKMALIRLRKGDDHHHKHHPSSSFKMDDMEDPSVKIFFSINDLEIGKTIEIYFSRKDPSNSPHFLSRAESNSIPFSSTQLPYLLQFFSLPKNSPQANAMEYTLAQCELEPMQGEDKFCSTSLESMLDSARSVFGSGTKLKALTTNYLNNSISLLQNYTILEEPKEILAEKMLGCHTMPYPYLVYYCHSPQAQGQNKVFEILLRGEKGDLVKATGACHMDTSKWDTDNPSFRLLNIKPGSSSPVCHVFPIGNIAWVPLSA